MGIIEASGLSISTVTTRGKPHVNLGCKGTGGGLTVVKGHPVLICGANGLAVAQISTLGHLAKLVELASITAISSTKIRVTFDRPMKKDSKLLDPDNYVIEPATTFGVALYYDQVIPEPNETEPTYVDIVTTEMTDGVLYEGYVEIAGGPVDPEDTPMDPSSNFDFFYGIGESPELFSVTAVGINRVDVKFNDRMDDNAPIRDVNNYAFDQGLTIISVLDVVGDTVKLITSDQTPGVLYTLTITQP